METLNIIWLLQKSFLKSFFYSQHSVGLSFLSSENIFLTFYCIQTVHWACVLYVHGMCSTAYTSRFISMPVVKLSTLLVDILGSIVFGPYHHPDSLKGLPVVGRVVLR